MVVQASSKGRATLEQGSSKGRTMSTVRGRAGVERREEERVNQWSCKE